MDKHLETDIDTTFTLNDVIEVLGFGKFHVKLTVAVGLTWMADAIAVTLLAVLGPSIQCYWNLSEEEVAAVSTCVFIGMFFGCPFWGFVCDRFGRKVTITISVIWIALFGLVNSVVPYYMWLLASMTIQGFGVAGVGQSVTLYSEFLPASYRASGVIFINVFYVIGNIFSVLLAYFTLKSFGWRMFTLLCGSPIVIVSVFMWWLPESPRFLVAVGKYKEAFNILKRVAKTSMKDLPEGHLHSHDNVESKNRGKFLELLQCEHRRTTLILWLLWFTAIFSYYGVILLTNVLLSKPDCYVSNSDFKRAVQNTTVQCHIVESDNYIKYLITVLGEIPGLLLTFFLVEKIGRKPTLVLFFLISSLLVTSLQLCLNRKVLVLLIFGMRAFITGIVQTVYLYTPEVYPTHIRAIGLGTAAGFSRLGAIVTPYVSQVIIQETPGIAIFIYSLLLFLCVGGSLLLSKETKGMQLQVLAGCTLRFTFLQRN